MQEVSKKLVKEYARAVERDPNNLAARLKLAAALRDVGRAGEASSHTLHVARAYRARGRLQQALAVCRGALDVDAKDLAARQLADEIELLLAEAESASAARTQELPQRDEPSTAWQREVGRALPLPGSIDEEGISEDSDPTQVQEQVVRPTDDQVTARIDINDQVTNPRFDAMDEATRVAAPGETSTLVRLSALESQTFEALDRLAPDGAAIEPPLGVFSELPPDAFDELQRRLKRLQVPKGKIIVKEGDAGTSLFIVEQGLVRIMKRDPAAGSGRFVEVGRLGDGSLFGEFAVFTDRKRHASVQALEETSLVEIPRELLEQLADEYEGVGPALQRLFRERLIATLLATAVFFQPLPEEDRVKLMARFEQKRVARGQAAITEGDMAVGLSLVVLGKLRVTCVVDGKSRVLANLGEGSYFGEMSLLSAGPATATVTAMDNVELAHLPAKQFYDVASSYPVLWGQISQEAQRRAKANHSLLTGEAQLV